jgi:hypothetical protein
MNEGVRRKKALWGKSGRAQLESLLLAPWAARRRHDLLELLDRLNPTIEELSAVVEQQVKHRPDVLRLMTHPGVGATSALAFVLIIDSAERFACGKQITSYVGLIPSEDSSSDRRRLGHITVQIATQHPEAVSQCAGIGVEEWLLFDRVALHSTGVAPGNVQDPASVVANLADTWLALWDRATVATGKTAYAVAVKSLVKFALADIFVNDIPQRRHTTQLRQATSDHILLKGAPVRRNWECIRAYPLAPHAQSASLLASSTVPARATLSG